MADRVAIHYSENLKLADAIAEKLRSAGKDPNKLTTADLVAVDEFHIRGRKATLELGERMKLNARSHILDIGSVGWSSTNVGRDIRLPSYRRRFDSSVLRRSHCDVQLGWARQPRVIQARGRHKPALRKPDLRCGDDNPRCNEHCRQGQDVFGRSQGSKA